MAEVALAVGLRQRAPLQRDLPAAVRPPAGALRRAGGRKSRRQPARCRSVLLRYRPPYDWDAMLAFLGARAIPGVEVVDARRLSPHASRSTAAAAWSRSQPAPANRAAGRRSAFPKLSALPAIIARLRRVFDLAADPGAIGAHLAQDPALAPLVAARPGLRVPGAWDGFELAVRAVLGQQITVAGRAQLAGKLVAALRRAAAPATRDAGPDAMSSRRRSGWPARISPPSACPARAPAALSALAAAVVADPADLRPAARASRGRSRSCGRCRGSANGRRSTSPCASCASPTPSRPPTSACCAPWPMRDGPASDAGRAARARERWRPWRAYAAQHLWAAGAQHPALSKKADAREAA